MGLDPEWEAASPMTPCQRVKPEPCSLRQPATALLWDGGGRQGVPPFPHPRPAARMDPNRYRHMQSTGEPWMGLSQHKGGALGSLPAQSRQPGTHRRAAWGHAPAGRDARCLFSPAAERWAF